MNELAKDPGKREVAFYDPEGGLKTVAVAEAAEKAAIRAVRADPDDPLARQRLRDIVERKLIEQRDYVVWRDVEMAPRRDQGAAGRGNKNSRVPAVALPAFDPGQDIVDRWREALVKEDFDAARSRRALHRRGPQCIIGTQISDILDVTRTRLPDHAARGSVSRLSGRMPSTSWGGASDQT